MHHKLVFTALCSLGIFCGQWAYAETPASESGKPDRCTSLETRLEEFITNYANKKVFSSFASGVCVGDRLQFSTTYHNQLSTTYRIASISKIFTATAVMQLVEKGLVQLDQPITNYLPDAHLEKKGLSSRPVTVRDLLSHTSGLPDIRYFRPPYNADFPSLKKPVPGQIYPAGIHYRYSNYGFMILGKLVETVSGMPLKKYLQECIFQPAGMKYAVTKDALLTGADGVMLSIHDMANFAYMWLNNGMSVTGIQVLKPETVHAMLTEQLYIPDAVNKRFVGLGWQVRKDAGGIITFFHVGGADYVAAWIQMFPKYHAAVMYLGNPPVFTPDASYFFDSMQKRLAEIATEMVGAPRNISYFRATLPEPGRIRKYVGNYQNPISREISVVYLKGNNLYLKNDHESVLLNPITTHIFTGSQGELTYDFVCRPYAEHPDGLATHYGYYLRMDNSSALIQGKSPVQVQ